MKTFKAYKDGPKFDSMKEMIKHLEFTLEADRAAAAMKLSFLAKRKATYYFIRLVSSFIKIPGGRTMEQTEEFVRRRMQCKTTKDRS